MPFKAPVQEKCPLCDKSVYASEAIASAGAKWHKMCFKCTECKKLLDSSTVRDNAGKLYCKMCHGRNFGMKGYGFGGGSGALASEAGTTGISDTAPKEAGIAGPRVEGGCIRCGKRVYEAEKKVGAGGDWHKTCFNCATCHKSLDSSTLTEKESEIYCKACYAKNFGPHGKV